jgi:hypothetical protein
MLGPGRFSERTKPARGWRAMRLTQGWPVLLGKKPMAPLAVIRPSSEFSLGRVDFQYPGELLDDLHSHAGHGASADRGNSGPPFRRGSERHPGWKGLSSPWRYLAYFRSEDQGKLTKFARLSKQMFPYILRYDARRTGSL